MRDLAVLSYREQMKNPEALIGQLSDLLGAGDWRLLFQLMEDLPKVTLADVERVRGAYFRAANRTVGIYLPTKEVERVSIPLAPPLEERLAQLKPPPTVEMGEQVEPVPTVLAERTTYERLPSGIALQTLRKRTRGNTVVARIHLRFGEPQETTLRKGTSMVGELMSEGSTSMDKQGLQDTLIRLKGGLFISSGNQEATIQMVAEKGSLIEMMKVAADLLQHPKLPADAFERIRSQRAAALEAQRQDLGTLLSEATREHFNAARGVKVNDPAYMVSLDQQLAETKATKWADVVSFHEDHWSANDAHVSVVGAVPDGFAQAVDSLLGSWKKASAIAYQRYIPRHVQVQPKRFEVEAKDKTSAMFNMVQRFSLNERDPDHLPLQLATQILGAGGMESRLSTRIRRQLGLSYGVGARLEVSYWGDDAALSIGGSFAPENRDKLLSAVRDELMEFASKGPSQAELERAKHDRLEARKKARANDASLTGTLIFHSTEHLNWTFEAQKDADIEAVTLERVNAAWRRHVKADQFVEATAGDFKAAPPK